MSRGDMVTTDASNSIFTTEQATMLASTAKEVESFAFLDFKNDLDYFLRRTMIVITITTTNMFFIDRSNSITEATLGFLWRRY